MVTVHVRCNKMGFCKGMDKVIKDSKNKIISELRVTCTKEYLCLAKRETKQTFYKPKKILCKSPQCIILSCPVFFYNVEYE